MEHSTGEGLWLTLFGLQAKYHELKSSMDTHKAKTDRELSAIREELDAHKDIPTLVTKYVKRWPLLVASFGLVAANADPNSVIDALVKLLEAMKSAT